MSQPTCIMLVCNTAWGIVNFRANLIQHWVAQGKRVISVAPADERAQAKLTALGSEFLALPLDNRGSNPWHELKVIWRLYRYYRQYQPDLVIHYTIKPVIYGSWAAALAGVPSLAVITGQGYAFLNRGVKAWLARNLYRVSLRLANAVWFLNADDFHLFTSTGLAPVSRSAQLPGEGVDTQRFAPQPVTHQDGRVRFLLIARLLYDKGIAEYAQAGLLLQAMHQTHQLPEVELQLLGPFYPQNPQAIAPEQIAQWHTQGALTYLGETDDVLPYLAACDVLVLPSYGEGLPRTILEAMSMAKPVIATRVTGCQDLVVHEQTGLLCSVRDAQALADAIVMLSCRSQEERAQMGEAGRERVLNQFSDAQVLAHYDAFLQQLG